MCQNYKSETGCKHGNKCYFRHVETEEKPSKKSKKGGAKGSVALSKESSQCGCVSQDSHSRKLTPRKKEKSGSNRAVKFSSGTWHHKKSGKKGSIAERNPCAPTFEERTQDETLHRRAAWDLAKINYKLKNAEKATCYSPIEIKVVPAHISKSPEERKFVVDSGASMHMLDKKDLGSQETLRRSRTPTLVVTANVEVQTNKEAQVHVHDPGLFVTVQLLEDTPAVPSLGKLCEEHGYSHEWTSGQKTTVDQRGEENYMQNGQFRTSCCSRVVIQFWYQFVFNIDTAHLVQPQSDARDRPNNPKPKDGNRVSDDRLRDLPEWLEEFTDNQEDTELPVSAHISQDSDSERPAKVASKSRKHSIYTHFPKDRNCEVCLRTQIAKSLCRRHTGKAVPRAEKFGDLMAADHKVLHEEGESLNKHLRAVVVQESATQWIQSYPCKTKTSQETEKSSRKCLESESVSSRCRSPKLFTLTMHWSLAYLCRIIMESYRTSTPHRSETNGIAERAVRRGKEGNPAVLVHSGLDEKWWADSMTCYCYLRNVQDLLSDGKTPNEG